MDEGFNTFMNSIRRSRSTTRRRDDRGGATEWARFVGPGSMYRRCSRGAGFPAAPGAAEYDKPATGLYLCASTSCRHGTIRRRIPLAYIALATSIPPGGLFRSMEDGLGKTSRGSGVAGSTGPTSWTGGGLGAHRTDSAGPARSSISRALARSDAVDLRLSYANGATEGVRSRRDLVLGTVHLQRRVPADVVKVEIDPGQNSRMCAEQHTWQETAVMQGARCQGRY